MNRVRFLLVGLLALFFPSISFAVYPGVCKIAVSYLPVNKTGTGNFYPTTFNVNLSSGDITLTTSSSLSNSDYYIATVSIYYKETSTGSWLVRTTKTGIVGGGSGLPGYIGNVTQLSTYLAAAPCSSCDTTDSDNDGVCDSCDKLPGQPDKKHCVWNQSYTADGRIGFMEIDQSGNCDGSSLASYKNSELDAETQYFDISQNHEELAPPTCAAADGACTCDYDHSVPSTLSPTSDSVDPKTQEELDKLPEDSNCAQIKSACESACLKYGGTKTNTCSSTDGKNHASCACLDSTTINTITKNTTTTTSSSGGDVTSTGGQDSNADGKDDTYAAVKDAIADSGIGGKLNDTNSLLNGIGNSLNAISNSIQDGLGAGDKDINTSGSADLPEHNNYDASVDELQEVSFGDAIINFMSSGLPLVDFIRHSGINTGSGESSITISLFGANIDLDFLPYSDLLEWVGVVLVFIATIIAFRIITNS